MNKSFFSIIIFGVALFTATSCYALTLGQVGEWHTSAELPKVVTAINQLLPQTTDAAQKSQLETLSKQVSDLQEAEHNINVTSDAWDKMNQELSKINHSGVDKQGHPYSWSGHKSADGTTDPRWKKVQEDQQAANADAASKRAAVKTTIQSLDMDLQNKIEPLIK